MNNRFLILPALILFCTLQIVAGQTVNRCLPFFTKEKIGFDLVDIDKATQNKGYSVGLPTHNNTKLETLVINGAVEFNLCAQLQKPEKCKDVPGEAFAYYFTDTKCLPMVILTSNSVREPISLDSKVNGVAITYNNDNLDDSKKKAMGPNLRFKITCNKDKTGVAQWSSQVDGNVVTLSTEHATGCGKGLEYLLAIFEEHKYICSVIFVFIGVIFCFFGRNAYKWTLLLCGFLLGFFAIGLLSYSFGLLNNPKTSTTWIILGLSVLAGLIVGFLLFKFEVATIMLVCGCLFGLIAIAILATFLAGVEINKWLELVIVIVISGIGAALGAYFKE